MNMNLGNYVTPTTTPNIDMDVEAADMAITASLESAHMAEDINNWYSAATNAISALANMTVSTESAQSNSIGIFLTMRDAGLLAEDASLEDSSISMESVKESVIKLFRAMGDNIRAMGERFIDFFKSIFTSFEGLRVKIGKLRDRATELQSMDVEQVSDDIRFSSIRFTHNNDKLDPGVFTKGLNASNGVIDSVLGDYSKAALDFAVACRTFKVTAGESGPVVTADQKLIAKHTEALSAIGKKLSGKVLPGEMEINFNLIKAPVAIFTSTGESLHVEISELETVPELVWSHNGRAKDIKGKVAPASLKECINILEAADKLITTCLNRHKAANSNYLQSEAAIMQLYDNLQRNDVNNWSNWHYERVSSFLTYMANLQNRQVYGAAKHGFNMTRGAHDYVKKSLAAYKPKKA